MFVTQLRTLAEITLTIQTLICVLFFRKGRLRQIRGILILFHRVLLCLNAVLLIILAVNML